MDIYGRGLSPSRSGRVATSDQPKLPLLGELALVLPARMARGVMVLIRPGSSQPGRDGIAVAPMSTDWLQQSAATSGKHGDPP